MTVHPICQSVFEKAFPASADAEVVRAVTEGVLLADDLLPGIRQKYAMLTFSADHKGRIQHVCWGMPPRDGDEWLAHINVLHRIELPVITPAEARPDKTAKLKFKKYVEESLSKKDDEKKSS